MNDIWSINIWPTFSVFHENNMFYFLLRNSQTWAFVWMNGDLMYVLFYLLIGCRHGFVMNISWKYGLQIANTILWAWSNLPSHANVTSTKSPRSNKFWKPDAIFSYEIELKKQICWMSERKNSMNLSKKNVSIKKILSNTVK